MFKIKHHSPILTPASQIPSILAILLLLGTILSACGARVSIAPAELPDERGYDDPGASLNQATQPKIINREGKNYVYDEPRAVYQSLAEDNLYFQGNRYYKLSADGWLMATSIHGEWQPITTDKLPEGLRASD